MLRAGRGRFAAIVLLKDGEDKLQNVERIGRGGMGGGVK
jgi:hypothetical protein